MCAYERVIQCNYKGLRCLSHCSCKCGAREHADTQLHTCRHFHSDTDILSAWVHRGDGELINSHFDVGEEKSSFVLFRIKKDSANEMVSSICANITKLYTFKLLQFTFVLSRLPHKQKQHYKCVFIRHNNTVNSFIIIIVGGDTRSCSTYVINLQK